MLEVQIEGRNELSLVEPQKQKQCPCEHLRFFEGGVKCAYRNQFRHKLPKNIKRMLCCTYNYYNFRDCPNSKDWSSDRLEFEKSVLQYLQQKGYFLMKPKSEFFLETIKAVKNDQGTQTQLRQNEDIGNREVGPK